MFLARPLHAKVHLLGIVRCVVLAVVIAPVSLALGNHATVMAQSLAARLVIVDYSEAVGLHPLHEPYRRRVVVPQIPPCLDRQGRIIGNVCYPPVLTRSRHQVAVIRTLDRSLERTLQLLLKLIGRKFCLQGLQFCLWQDVSLAGLVQRGKPVFRRPGALVNVVKLVLPHRRSDEDSPPKTVSQRRPDYLAP